MGGGDEERVELMNEVSTPHKDLQLHTITIEKSDNLLVLKQANTKSVERGFIK